MPKFLVAKVYEFSPGIVDGSTESPPDDLLTEQARIIKPLARWPLENLEINRAEEALG